MDKMKLKKQSKRMTIHHTVMMESIPYLRNETLVYNLEISEWDRESLHWSVGDKDGRGPYVKPSGSLDEFKKYTSEGLEEQFQLKFR